MLSVDAPEKLRLNRSLVRDTAHRGRTRQSVIDQWESSVQVMSVEFGVPTRQYTDLVVDGESSDDISLHKVLSLCTDKACDGLS